MYNPLDCQEQKSMIVEYQAAVIDAAWQDRKCTILQLQTAVKRYLQPGETETEVHSPILEIVKESDKKRVCVR
mgnify:CR=1 FL=1